MTALAHSYAPLPRGPWRVDAAASTVGFRVRHFRFATVSGTFSRFAGILDAGHAEGWVEVASIETGHPVRDERLRSEEFFDAERFPRIGFEASPPLGAPLAGRLTIRDVTRPLLLDVTTAPTADGRLGLRASAGISRRAFGLDWAGLVEAGRLIVSDRVELTLDLVLVSG